MGFHLLYIFCFQPNIYSLNAFIFIKSKLTMVLIIKQKCVHISNTQISPFSVACSLLAFCCQYICPNIVQW